MGILKFTFFRVLKTKKILLGVSGSTLNLMAWACKGCTSTSEIKNFDFRVKPKVLNDEKTLKTSKFDTRLCHALPFHYDVKMTFYTS